MLGYIFFPLILASSISVVFGFLLLGSLIQKRCRCAIVQNLQEKALWSSVHSGNTGRLLVCVMFRWSCCVYAKEVGTLLWLQGPNIPLPNIPSSSPSRVLSPLYNSANLHNGNPPNLKKKERVPNKWKQRKQKQFQTRQSKFVFILSIMLVSSTYPSMFVGFWNNYLWGSELGRLGIAF